MTKPRAKLNRELFKDIFERNWLPKNKPSQKYIESLKLTEFIKCDDPKRT